MEFPAVLGAFLSNGRTGGGCRKSCVWDRHERAEFRNQENGGFGRGVFAKMYASLGCGALSTKCTAGPIPWVLLVSLAVPLHSTETPFAKTPSS